MEILSPSTSGVRITPTLFIFTSTYTNQYNFNLQIESIINICRKGDAREEQVDGTRRRMMVAKDDYKDSHHVGMAL